MHSRVLVPMDGSEMAEQAFEVHPDAEITFLTVVGEPSAMWGEATAIALVDDIERAAAELAEPVFARAREILAHAGDFDAVVIGSHGGSLTDRLLLGNVVEKVFRGSPVPVTAVR